MKFTAFFILLAGFSVNAMAQSAVAPPKAVLSSFSTQFPDLTAETWSEEDGIWESVFHHKGFEVEGKFESSGKWLRTEMQIDDSYLPTAVKDVLAKEFGTFRLAEAEMTEDVHEGVRYELRVESNGQEIEMELDKAGTILARQIEDEND